MRARAFFGSCVAVALGWGVLATACGGSTEDDEAAAQRERDRQEAKDYYVARVHPTLTSCVQCHGGGVGPRIMAAEANDSYAAIERTAGLIAAPKNSPLIQYVHKDPAIAVNADQRNVLTQWLSLEATARGLAGAIEKPKTVTEAYKQFADCMNFDVWTYYRMGDLPFTQTDTEGPCLGCHSTGQGSAWLSAGARETFDKTRGFPYIQKLVVGKLDERGSFEGLVASGRFIEKSNEQCPKEAVGCHPTYGLPPNVVSGIKGFVDTTLQNLAGGTCGSGIVVPQREAGPPDGGDGG